jgi:hypothetical protein
MLTFGSDGKALILNALIASTRGTVWTPCHRLGNIVKSPSEVQSKPFLNVPQVLTTRQVQTPYYRLGNKAMVFASRVLGKPFLDAPEALSRRLAWAPCHRLGRGVKPTSQVLGQHFWGVPIIFTEFLSRSSSDVKSICQILVERLSMLDPLEILPHL